MSEDYLPTEDEAMQFAVMLTAGMPPEEAIVYFFEDKDNALAAQPRWLSASTVKAAIKKLQGKSWQHMTADEKIQLALDKHYTELAYFLYSRNYVNLQGQDKAKADTCRTTLEVKQAGLAGKMEPLAVFWNDVKSGKVKLNVPTPAASVPPVEAKH